MILDKLENQNLYVNTHSNLKKAFDFLLNNNLEELADGKYEIDSNNVFALVQSYTTKQEDNNKWESHQKYIDIQYIFKGNETILWTPVEELDIEEDYSEERDVAFYKNGSHFTKLNLKDNYFCILFPEDGHKPGCIFDEPTKIKKVVLKIKL
jgi:YhcH/YjgK/YiaL family protein